MILNHGYNFAGVSQKFEIIISTEKVEIIVEPKTKKKIEIDFELETQNSYHLRIR